MSVGIRPMGAVAGKYIGDTSRKKCIVIGASIESRMDGEPEVHFIVVFEDGSSGIAPKASVDFHIGAEEKVVFAEMSLAGKY